MSSKRILGWKGLTDAGYTEHRAIHVEAGMTLRQPRGLPRELCAHGLFHFSERAIDMLEYAPGSTIARVEGRGTLVKGDDKCGATVLQVLWVADATRTYHEFALWCAEGALQHEREAGREPHPDSWNALVVKRLWLDGKATDKEMAAAWAAAWDAARTAARAAARDAAWDAARTAAWAAARTAARAAARDAAWAAAKAAARDAAWAAQNKKLTTMLLALAPSEYQDKPR